MGSMPFFPSVTWSSSLLEQAISSYSPTSSDQPVSSAAFRSLASQLLEAGLRLLSAAAPGVQLTGLEIFSAGMRSVVLRLELAGFSAPSVVLKYFRRRDSARNSGGFGYLREKQGLGALEQLAPGLYPRLLAADDSARLLLLEDVSGGRAGQSLADLLLSAQVNPVDGLQAAQRALELWTATWAGLLRSPAQAAAQASFTAELARADGRASAPGSLPSPQLALKGLPLLAKRQGLRVGSAEFARMEQAVANIIYPAAAERLLSSGDFSPANLVQQAAPGVGVRGIDAEGSCWHHWALPVAELLLGFPSWPEGPVSADLLGSDLWQGAAQRFYEQLAPAPLSDLGADRSVVAAQLTIRAILAEQGKVLSALPMDLLATESY